MRIRKSWLFFAVVVLAVLLTAALLQAEPKDGRLNIETHFGGDALYCVDVNMMPTTVYPSDGKGGLRLLNMAGEEKWFVPAATILAKVAEATASNAGVEVANGWGTYGPAVLYVYVAGGIPKFTFAGWDEHNKQNSFQFTWCDPVGKRTFPEAKTGGLECGSDAADSEFGDTAFVECSQRAGCGDHPDKECFCDAYPNYSGCEEK